MSPTSLGQSPGYLGSTPGIFAASAAIASVGARAGRRRCNADSPHRSWPEASRLLERGCELDVATAYSPSLSAGFTATEADWSRACVRSCTATSRSRRLSAARTVGTWTLGRAGQSPAVPTAAVRQNRNNVRNPRANPSKETEQPLTEQSAKQQARPPLSATAPSGRGRHIRCCCPSWHPSLL